MAKKRIHHNHQKNLFKKLCRNFKSQFKFSLHKRNTKRPFLSKIFGDELITITNYKYNIIKCKNCLKTSKTYLDRRRYCLNCIWDTGVGNKRNRNSVVEWSVWGGVIPH